MTFLLRFLKTIMNRSLSNLILLQDILFAIKVISMLGVNDGPIITDDYISIQIFRNAVDKVIDEGIRNRFLLHLMGYIISQMSNFLQPAMQEIPELFAGVFEFSLLLLIVFCAKVFRERSPVYLLIIVKGMQGPRSSFNSIRPFGVVDEGCSHVEEVVNLNGSQAQENTSGLQGTVDAMKNMIEVVHPMQTEEAVSHIILRNIIELSLDVFFPEVDLRVVCVLSLIKTNHILRDVVPNDLFDLYTILDQSIPQGKSGEAVSAAQVQDAEGSLFVLVLVGDDLDESIYGSVVKPLLEMVYLRIISVEGFLCGLELDDLIHHLVKHISYPFSVQLWLGSFLLA